MTTDNKSTKSKSDSDLFMGLVMKMLPMVHAAHTHEDFPRPTKGTVRNAAIPCGVFELIRALKRATGYYRPDEELAGARSEKPALGKIGDAAGSSGRELALNLAYEVIRIWLDVGLQRDSVSDVVWRKAREDPTILELNDLLEGSWDIDAVMSRLQQFKEAQLRELLARLRIERVQNVTHWKDLSDLKHKIVSVFRDLPPGTRIYVTRLAEMADLNYEDKKVKTAIQELWQQDGILHKVGGSKAKKGVEIASFPPGMPD